MAKKSSQSAGSRPAGKGGPIPPALCKVPESYHKALSVDMTTDRALLQKVSGQSILLFLVSIALTALPVFFRLFVAGDILYYVGGAARLFSLGGLVKFLLILVAMQFVVILLHESIHGVFFRLYMRHSPDTAGQSVRYGFEKGMAYAGCPGVYFSRRAYRVIGLAPLLFLSIPTYALLFLCSLGRIGGYVAIASIFWLNTSGAAADIYTFRLMGRYPKDSYWLDTDTGCDGFVRARSRD